MKLTKQQEKDIQKAIELAKLIPSDNHLILELQEKIVNSFKSLNKIDIEDDVIELILGNWTIDDFVEALDIHEKCK